MAVETPATDTIDQRLLLQVLTAFKRGDFSVRMPTDRAGIAGKIAETLNITLELADGWRGGSVFSVHQIFRKPQKGTKFTK